jgi:nitrogen fixation protein FixH
MRTRMRGMPALVLAVAIATGCSSESTTPSPGLTLSPTTATVTAGGAAVAFTATLTGSTATIDWSISPAVGTLSATTGASTSYTPPATVASATTVTLTATAGTFTATATITVNPPPAPTLTVSPTTATVTAGGAAAAFTATLTGSTATINWSLSPVVGTLSAATGASTSYTPPGTVASATTVTLTATAGALTATATITVNPAAAPTLSVSPTTATVTAGGTAVPFAATLTGSSATINWTLSPSLGTLSSATGTSTSYSPPGSVGSPQSVTLTATAGTLTATATITVNPGGGGTITVAGTVLLDDGTPLASAPVRINPGGHAATTAANGTFSIPGVTTPYDLSAINPAEKVAVVYVGLTRTNPTAIVPTRGAAPPFANQATISGAVESNTGCRAAMAPCLSFLGFGSSLASGTGLDIPSIGYSISLGWDGAASFQGTLHLLQSSTNTMTDVTSYWYGAKTGVNVTNGGTTTENWGSSSVASLPAATLGGTGTVASGYTVQGANLLLELPNVTLPATSCVPPAGPPCAAGAYTVDAPNVAGATLAGLVFAQGPNGESVFTQRRGGTPNATNFNYDIQAAPSLQAPANNATGTTTSTAFSWTPFAGGVHTVVFDPVVTTNPQYYVYTAGTSTTIPNLAAASASVALPAGAAYDWGVTGVAPVASVDAWAGASGPPIANPYTVGSSQGFTFTTQ